MHELSIALRLVELVEDQLVGEPPATVVTDVLIRVGEQSSVVPEALQFAWGPATDGTRLQGAALRLTAVSDSAALELAGLVVEDTP
jgi:hydrogenase nickel incorporation protein HypA/HybF